MGVWSIYIVSDAASSPVGLVLGLARRYSVWVVRELYARSFGAVRCLC